MPRLIRPLSIGAIVLGSVVCCFADEKKYTKPVSLTHYDFATREDLFLARMVSPLVKGDEPNDWALLEDLETRLGGWVTQYLTANQIANTINTSLSVQGQPMLKSVDRLVTECASTLHVKKPEVFIHSSSVPRCHLVDSGDGYFLILTSKLLELYEGREGELRFIVGHELGHLKCRHLKIKNAAYGILGAMQKIKLAAVPAGAQVLLPTLAMGRLCSWMQEADISADRAGLLCCQDPQVAYNALARQLSGLGAKSTWIDPESPDFDADALVREYRRWENEPFVDFVQHVKRFNAESPFIPERVAALKLWADSGSWRKLLNREADESEEDLLIVIDAISISKLSPKDEPVDPYVIVYGGYKKVVSTKRGKGVNGATWKSINAACRHKDGKPLYFEVWDKNFTQDVLLAGFTIFPQKRDDRGGKIVLHESLEWNWKERSNITRQGHAQVRFYFKERAKERDK